MNTADSWVNKASGFERHWLFCAEDVGDAHARLAVLSHIVYKIILLLQWIIFRCNNNA